MTSSNQKIKIGIFGASSQIGASLAFFLKHFTEVEVICFVRSTYSKPFFELLSIPVETTNLSEIEKLRDQLQSVDVLIDCSYPSGQIFEIPEQLKRNLELLITSLRPGSRFIYMSSIMAYGMRHDERRVKDYKIPRSSYAYIKRIAEDHTKRLCKERSVAWYNFRLAQVHGFLQSVNTAFREKLSSTFALNVNSHELDKANIIFIHSVAKAILDVADNKLKSGIYTLVAYPQWTLKELYDYYKTYYQISTAVYFRKSDANRGNISPFSWMLGKLKQYRPVLETYVLMRMPSLSLVTKGKYRVEEVKIRRNAELSSTRVVNDDLLGEPSISPYHDENSGFSATMEYERKAEKLYNDLLKSWRK